jgi:hypothetical protein
MIRSFLQCQTLRGAIRAQGISRWQIDRFGIFITQDSQEDRRSDLIAGVQAVLGPPITFEMAGHVDVFLVDY